MAEVFEADCVSGVREMQYELNNYYNCDCMVAMAEMPDKYFELAIVDPPYGINATKMSMGTNLTRKKGGYPSQSTNTRIRKGRLNSGAGKLKNRNLQKMNCEWDFFPPDKEYFKELFRVSKNQIIFGGNYFGLPPTRGIFVWDKVQPLENFSQIEYAWTSFDKPAKLFRLSNTGGANAETKIHPTQKSIKLYEEVLRAYATKGDKIIDTHVGSASSLIACYNMGFEYMGFEIDKDYYKNSLKRLNAYMAQVRFDW